MNQDGKTKRVVVIGAGAAGIGAARTLAAAGAEVIVLEGRDRIGGRMKKHCLTKNLSSSFGVGAEHFVNIQLGANWIHGMESTNPMFEVAQKLGLELHQTSSDDDPGDDVILFDSGDCSSSDKVDGVAYGRVSKEDYHESLSRYEWIKEYVDHISVNYDKEDISLQAAFDLALKASESEIFGPCPDAQKRCLTWLYDRVSIDLGALSSKVSLNCYAEGVSDGAGGEGLVKYVGYSHVLHHLAHEFPLDIRLNHAVARIAVRNANPDKVFEHPGIATLTSTELSQLSSELQGCTLRDGRCVSIECANGEALIADACVITVPVGALQADIIEFAPRPPSVISSVCSSLKLGLMNLVWLWYPEVFWPEECNFLGIARDDGSNCATNCDTSGDGNCGAQKDGEVKFTTFLIPPVFDNHGVRQPVLMCQIVGPYATTIESMSDAEIAAEATSTLRAMFGAAYVPDPIGCAHSQWGSDPFSRGSWSYFPYRADNSSFASGSVSRGETDGWGAIHPGSAIVGAVRESELYEGATSQESDGSSFAAAGLVGFTPGPSDASHITLSLAPFGENVHPPATNALLTSGCAGRPQDTTGASNSVTFASENPSALPVPLQRAVSISEAASSVLGGVASHSGVPPSTVRKYSDFGCTSDGTEDSSESDDSDGEGTGLGGTGSTSGSSASSSDESPSAAHASLRYNHNGNHANAPRTVDDVVSAHLYYASEAMSVQNRGTVHGAYLSGIREASKILAFLEERAK